jgi:hypothetical protein
MTPFYQLTSRPLASYSQLIVAVVPAPRDSTTLRRWPSLTAELRMYQTLVRELESSAREAFRGRNQKASRDSEQFRAPLGCRTREAVLLECPTSSDETMFHAIDLDIPSEFCLCCVRILPDETSKPFPVPSVRLCPVTVIGSIYTVELVDVH